MTIGITLRGRTYLLQPVTDDTVSLCPTCAGKDVMLDGRELCNQLGNACLERGGDVGRNWQLSTPAPAPAKEAPHAWLYDRDLQRQARATDPGTSTRAATKVRKYSNTIGDRIVQNLCVSHGTGKELSARLDIALNSITPRFAKLVRDGRIHAKERDGRETVWAYGPSKEQA